MGTFSLWHWLIVLAVAMLIFGGTRVSGLMGEFGRGLRLFKREMNEASLMGADDGLRQPPNALATAQHRSE